MLKPLDRDPINLETLQLFRRVTGQSSRLDDPETVQEFMRQVAQALAASTDNLTRLRGIRTQALFAQLVVALDACELMLTVDAGDIYADGLLSSGDFLLVLRNGRRLLVEVKTVSRVHDSAGDVDVTKSQRKSVRRKDVDGLRRAAKLLGAEPFFAAYFELLRHWALVRPDDLSSKGLNYTLQFTHDVMHNHMSILGDRTLAVEPPIEIRLHPRLGHEPEAVGLDEERPVVPFKAARRTVHVGGEPVTNPEDSRFALFLGLYGWDPEFVQTVQDGKVAYVSIVSAPAEPVESQGFQIIGPLSHMYSKYFEVRTTDDEGEPSALDIQATPSLIASFLSPHPKDRQFKTWQWEVRASEAEVQIGQEEEASSE